MSEYEIYNGDIKKTLKMFRHDNVILVFLALFAVVIGILIASIIMFYNNQQNTDKIQGGVFIKGINVSGLTKQQAIEHVNKELSKQMNDQIELLYKNNNYYVEIEQIEARFDVE